MGGIQNSYDYMARIYSSSFFHYTSETGLVSILQNGFYGSYADEQFKDNNGNIQHLYIPMVSFCDIPLSYVETITYGNYAIGMSRIWGNNNGLSPILYYPRAYAHHLHQFVRKSFDDYMYKNDTSQMKFLGYVKPFKKFDEKGYADKKRKENYIEREWRKIYITQWIKSRIQMEDYREKYRNKFIKNFIMKFNAKDVSFIIVPDEKAKANMITQIGNNMRNIGGGSQQLQSRDIMDLVSKILTIKQISANF